jgi:CubicO group peptidase (beta-lactamase class C family)
VQTDGTDLVMGLPLTYCLGYARRGGVFQEFGPRESTIFWGGAGGSMLIIDTKNHICFSYVMNQMSNNLLGDKRSDNLGTALYASL